VTPKSPYPKPPISEAILQLRFGEPLQPWSVATPGRIFEKISRDYPAEPEIQQQVEASLQAEGLDQQRSTTFAFNQGRQRILYKSADSKRLIMIAQDHIAASSLPPYEGWERFSQRLRQARATIGTVVNFPKVQQVSVRYLNRIVINDAEAIETNDYFQIPIQTAEQGKARLANFISRVESVIDDATRVNCVFASLQSPPNEYAVLLDIEVVRIFEEHITVSEAFKQLARLRRIKNSEFEASITDKARELFQ
jgi:uncharacterized protein (TIGR04255 family)